MLKQAARAAALRLIAEGLINFADTLCEIEDGALENNESDETATNALDELIKQLADFTDDELRDICKDGGSKPGKGVARDKLIEIISDAIKAEAIDLNDYFEDGEDEGEDEGDDDDAEDSDKKYNAEELVEDWSDKDIKDLLTANKVKFGKKAERGELITTLQDALDADLIDLSEYDFEDDED